MTTFPYTDDSRMTNGELHLVIRKANEAHKRGNRRHYDQLQERGMPKTIQEIVDADPYIYKIDYEILVQGRPSERTLTGDWSLAEATAMLARLYEPEWGAVTVSVRRTDRKRDTRPLADRIDEAEYDQPI